MSCLALDAAVRFTQPVWREDLSMSVPCLEGAVGEPLDLPRAEAYLVTRDGKSFLEDRYDSFDLWVCHALRGRWRDADGNRLYIARLDSLPLNDTPGITRTRKSFRKELEQQIFNPKDPADRDVAAAAVSPVDLERAVKPRRAQRRNFSELVSYITTNEQAIVCAFRLRNSELTNGKKPSDWYLVALIAADGQDMAEVRARFDEDFLDEIRSSELDNRNSNRRITNKQTNKRTKDSIEQLTEFDLLRDDVRKQVVNYDEWAATDADDVTVIDNLDIGVRAGFMTSLTNNLPRLRREYVGRVPSPLVGTNALAVVRVFKRREEYLAYVGVDHKWTAAVWSPVRRELVMYHPEQGLDKLLRTVWHEAFHQYLAYAGSMIESSPWFNEGHSQLFENSHFDSKGNIVFERDAEAAAYVHEYASQLAGLLPAVFEMDYTQFYSGTQEDISAKYRLAWSIAYFLEVGAPKLRFQPYAEFRSDYLKALVATKSMIEATRTVFGDEKSRDEFVAAWLAFWRE